MEIEEKELLKKYNIIFPKLNNRAIIDISNEHLSRLQLNANDLKINKIFIKFKIIHENFTKALLNRIVSENIYKCEMNKLAGIFEDLTLTKYVNWLNNIRKIYPQRSEQYKRLFETGDIQIESGEYINRLDNLKLLSCKLKQYKKLDVITNEIESFIKTTNKMVLDLKRKDEILCKDLMKLCDARKKLEETLYSDYCILINEFYETKDLILNYITSDKMLSN